MKFLLISILLFLFYNVNATGSGTRFYHLTHNQGLSQSTVLSVAKDNDGFFWFGTRNGLNRWDGYEFKIYTHKPSDSTSIIDGLIQDIYIDSKTNEMWVATLPDGLSKYNPQTDNFENYHFYQKSDKKEFTNYINHISRIDNKLLLSTARNGMYIFNLQNKRFQQIKLISKQGKNLSDIHTTYHIYDKDSTIWISYQNGILKVDSVYTLNERYIFIVEEIKKNIRASTLYADSDNNIWIGTYNDGVFCLKNNTDFIHYQAGSEQKNQLNYKTIFCFAENENGEILIGTSGGGINIFNKYTHTFSYYKHSVYDNFSINSNIIQCIYIDDSYNIWAGTYNRGVSYTNKYKQNFTYKKSFYSIKNLQSNSVLSFCEISQNNIWLGTDGSGLISYNPDDETFEKVKFNNVKKTDVIISIYKDRQDNIYLATFMDGIYKYNTKNNKWSNYKLFTKANNCIWDIAVDDKNNTLWAVSLGGGLYKLNLNNKSLKQYTPNPNDSNSIIDYNLDKIAIDSNGNLWIGTFVSGLVFMDKNNEGVFHNYRKGDGSGLSSNNIKDILITKNGSVLIATKSGINIFNDSTKTFSTINIGDGIYSNTIQAILEGDNPNELIISSNFDIHTITYSGTQIISDSDYNMFDGIEAGDFNIHSRLKTSNGNYYFGGTNGFNSFNPKNIHNNINSANIFITEMRIFDKLILPNTHNSPINKDIRYTKNIKLNHKQTSFSFTFAMLDYIVPEKNTYKYQLIGFDENWIDAGTERKAVYTNIQPGKYTFVVKGFNRFGKESKNKVSIAITIVPPFYRTLWFKFIIIISIFLIFISFYQYRIYLLRKQQALLNKTVKERTKELRRLNKTLERRNKEIEKQRVKLKKQKEELIVGKEKIEHQNQTLKEYGLTLESKVKERTYELEKALKKAEESEQLKMAFLANMSHEIRTPLNAIVGFATLLLDDDIDKADKKEFSELINKNSEALITLIEDILILSKIDSGQLEVAQSKINLNTLLSDKFNRKKKFAEHFNIEFNLSINTDNDINILYDESHLSKILDKILDNAFKFTPSGSVTLSLEEKDTNAVIAIKDTGIGIPEEKIKYIFELFRQGTTGNNKLYRGAGLGLTVCSKLVEINGGELMIESQQNKGSVFYFSIPIL